MLNFRGLLLVRHNEIRGGDHVGLRALLAGAETGAVDVDRLLQHLRGEMGREGIRQAERGGQLRAEKRGSEDVERHLGPPPRVGVHARYDGRVGEVAAQLCDVVGEVLGCVRIPPQGAERSRVGARRSSQAQADAAGIEGFEGAELLGDDERGVIGEHHAARAKLDLRGSRGHVGNEHGRRGGRDSRHVVMLGVPDAFEAQALCPLRQENGPGESVRRGFARPDEGQIEEGVDGHRGPYVAVSLEIIVSAFHSIRGHVRR